MSSRLRYKEVAPDVFRALATLQGHVRQSGLDARLVELVYLRVSQLNACAYCVHMHGKSLRAAGETDQRLDALVVWREAPFFTARERIALGWAESVTKLGPDHVPDALYDETQKEFGDALLVELTLAVATINAWNRMAISFRAAPGVDGAGQLAQPAAPPAKK